MRGGRGGKKRLATGNETRGSRIKGGLAPGRPFLGTVWGLRLTKRLVTTTCDDNFSEGGRRRAKVHQSSKVDKQFESWSTVEGEKKEKEYIPSLLQV